MLNRKVGGLTSRPLSPEKGKEKLPDICVKPNMSWWKRNVLEGKCWRMVREDERWNPNKPCNNREGIISFYASRHTSETFASNRMRKKQNSSLIFIVEDCVQPRQPCTTGFCKLCRGIFVTSSEISGPKCCHHRYAVMRLLPLKTSMIDDSCWLTISKLLAFVKFIQEIIHLGSIC